MTVNTNPSNGIASSNVNPATGLPAGFPSGGQQPGQWPQPYGTGVSNKTTEELLLAMVIEQRITNALLAMIAQVPDDLDTWRTDPSFNPNFYPLS